MGDVLGVDESVDDGVLARALSALAAVLERPTLIVIAVHDKGPMQA